MASGNGQNSLICGTQVRGAQAALVQAFTEEQASHHPRARKRDQRRAAHGGQHLGALPHAQTTNVVIFGDAVQTAAPIDLADPVQLADPVATLRAVMAQGLRSGTPAPAGGCTWWTGH